MEVEGPEVPPRFVRHRLRGLRNKGDVHSNLGPPRRQPLDQTRGLLVPRPALDGDQAQGLPLRLPLRARRRRTPVSGVSPLPAEHRRGGALLEANRRCPPPRSVDPTEMARGRPRGGPRCLPKRLDTATFEEVTRSAPSLGCPSLLPCCENGVSVCRLYFTRESWRP